MKKVPEFYKKTGVSCQQLKLFFLLLILAISSVLLFLEIFLPPIPALTLPPPDMEGNVPLRTAIYQSKIAESLESAEIDKNSISQLLWSLQGLTHGPDFRTVPSAGATYPLEIYFYFKGNSFLEEGIYRYIPRSHSIACLPVIPDFDLLLSATTSLDRESLGNVSIVFSIFADYNRTTSRYGARGIRYVHLEVGHAIQNFFLQSTAIGLHTRPVTFFTSESVQFFFNSSLTPLVMLPTGSSPEMITETVIKKKIASVVETDEITVEQALAKRASIRDYIEGEIPLAILIEVLKDSCKIPFLVGNSSQLDIRAVTGDVSGVISGNYQYLPGNVSLSLVTAGDFQDPLYDVSLEQPWIVTAQLDVIISMDVSWVNQQHEPAFFERMLLFNIGMVAQNIYHKCSAHGLGTVVIGAFSDNHVASLLDIPATFTPIYEMPIGLTPVYFEEDGFLELTELARWMGILVFIPLYVNFYLSVPALRGRIPRKIRRWVHCGFAVTPFTGAIIHFIIIHGLARNFRDFISPISYFESIDKLLRDILSLPVTQQDFGLLSASLGFSTVIITSLTGFLLLLKGFKHKKNAYRVHKYGLYLALLLLIIHGFLNHSFFPYSQSAFILIQIIAFDGYFILQTVPRIRKDSDLSVSHS